MIMRENKKKTISDYFVSLDPTRTATATFKNSQLFELGSLQRAA